jgi:hypothetical protein
VEIQDFKCQENLEVMYSTSTVCEAWVGIENRSSFFLASMFHLLYIQLDITNKRIISLIWLEVKKRKLDDVEIIGALKRWKWQMLLSNQQCKANQVYLYRVHTIMRLILLAAWFLRHIIWISANWRFFMP